MPDDDSDHDTELAPTEQASPPTTELPPANHAAAESVHAWSLDDTAEVDSALPRRGRLVSVGLVALVVVITGALIYLAATLFGSGSPKHVEPSAKPTMTVPVAAPPPPPPVTVTATPPPPPVTVTAAAPPPAALSSTDQQFLTVLRNMGLSYPDPDYAISHAHATCDFMANHGVRSGNMLAADYVARTTIWTEAHGQAGIFAINSAASYCPESQSE
jgi:hypothetical protein